MNAERFTDNDGNRVMLTAEDFLRLVRGGIVRAMTQEAFGNHAVYVSVALKDIGFEQMHMLIEEAEGLR